MSHMSQTSHLSHIGSERARIRRWRRIWHTRLFCAVGVILLAYTWLTLLPALWWSDIGRNAALELTIWFLIAQVWTLRLLWRWLRPLMRE